MPKSPKIREIVKVRHIDLYTYILHVEVTAICEFNEFIGRIDNIFAEGAGEISGGEILKLKGQQKTFKNSDVIP